MSEQAQGNAVLQAQDVVTIASFSAGLIVYAPWLIVLLLIALVPAFLGDRRPDVSLWVVPAAAQPARAT